MPNAPLRNSIVQLGLCLFIFMFLLLIYVVSHYFYYVDYSSLYAAMKALCSDNNPYDILYTDHLSVNKKLPVNLNPPFTLLLFLPFHFLPYSVGLMLYFFLAIVMGIGAAALCGHYFLQRSFWTSQRLLLLLLYSSMFSTVAGISIAQLGAPLFLLLMLGYGSYCQQKTIAASLFFALAIAIKLFPAVLFFFFMQQKRYRLCLFTMVWLVLFLCLPVWFFRQDIYHLYFSMMPRVMWFGDNWNGSFFAVLMRYFIDTNHTNITMWPYQLLWFVISAGILLAYTFSQKLINHPQRSFATALALMIVLSPFGWLYYFSLLMPALALCFHDAENKGLKAMLLWFVAYALINFPIDYVADKVMTTVWLKLSFYSLHSYGVFLLIFLLQRRSPLSLPNQTPYQRELLFWPVFYCQLMGVLVLINIIAQRISAN